MGGIEPLIRTDVFCVFLVFSRVCSFILTRCLRRVVFLVVSTDVSGGKIPPLWGKTIGNIMDYR